MKCLVRVHINMCWRHHHNFSKNCQMCVFVNYCVYLKHCSVYCSISQLLFFLFNFASKLKLFSCFLSRHCKGLLKIMGGGLVKFKGEGDWKYPLHKAFAKQRSLVVGKCQMQGCSPLIKVFTKQTSWRLWSQDTIKAGCCYWGQSLLDMQSRKQS